MLRPSPNHGTQRLPNDDDDDVLLVMTGCRLFHIFMVLGKKDVLNTCVRA